jgi:hypothetical protein
MELRLRPPYFTPPAHRRLDDLVADKPPLLHTTCLSTKLSCSDSLVACPAITGVTATVKATFSSAPSSPATHTPRPNSSPSIDAPINCVCHQLRRVVSCPATTNQPRSFPKLHEFGFLPKSTFHHRRIKLTAASPFQVSLSLSLPCLSTMVTLRCSPSH